MATGTIEKIVSFPEGYNKYRQTFNVSSGATKTISLDFNYGNRLLVTGHSSNSVFYGIYFLGASFAAPIVNSSSLTVTMSNGTIAIKNNHGSSTCTCSIF